MKIPEQLIEEIRQRSDIVEVIGETVRLKPQGKSFVGLCPFHADKKPSMNVNPQMGIFKCFSCGKGGNVITYVMDFHKLSFMEAIRQLAARAGMVLPEENTEEDQEKYQKNESIRFVLEAAQKYYHSLLGQKEAQIARSYISKRGFSQEIVSMFGIGYSPDAWRRLSEEMFKQGFSERLLEEAGLVIKREDNMVYDRFRGRLMFPIQDSSGRIIGFGARQLKEEKDQPKYINSPETVVYNKSQVLYGIFQAKNPIRNLGSAILTEGYADTITLHQYGFTNAIASSGTALTRNQLQLLSRYCKHVYIAYDGDTAGQNATLKGLELALEEGFDVKIMSFPHGEDPDSFVRSRGSDPFRSLMLSAVPFLDFRVEIMKANGILNDPPRMAQAIRDLIDLIVRIPDTMQHDLLLQRLWDKLRLSEMQLQRMYEEYRNRLQSRRGIQTKYISPKQSYSDTNIHGVKSEVLPVSADPEEQLFPEEKELLRLSFLNPKALRFMLISLDVKPDTMVSTLGKYFLHCAIEAMNENAKDIYSTLMQNADISDDNKDMMARVMLKREMPSENWKNFEVEIPSENQKKIMTDCLMRLRMRTIEMETETIKQKMNDISDEEQVSFMKKIIDLVKEKNDLTLKMKSFT